MFRIEGFIHRYFPDATPYGNDGTDMSVDCPFCGDTKHHLTISLEKEVCHCYRCDYKSSWMTLVMNVTGFNYYKAINELYYQPRLSDAESIIAKFHGNPAPLEKRGSVAELPRDFKLMVHAQAENIQLYKRYLIYRGFDRYYWEKYNLGMSRSYPMRIIIPIEEGYWQGRSIVNWQEPKYVNPKADSGSVIFNSEALKLYDEVVVCEGAFSAMAVGGNAIALIGKEVTPVKLERIVNSQVKKIVIALEPGAFDSMKMLMEAAFVNGKEVDVWRYNVGDPADSTDFDVLHYNLSTRVLLSFR